jgi:hypothetical protein
VRAGSLEVLLSERAPLEAEEAGLGGENGAGAGSGCWR